MSANIPELADWENRSLWLYICLPIDHGGTWNTLLDLPEVYTQNSCLINVKISHVKNVTHCICKADGFL